MGQEWDYPPNRKWKPEVTLLPGAKPEFRRFDKTIEHRTIRRKTGWAWYKGQVQGHGPLIYKMNVTALYLTFCAFIFVCVSVFGVIVGLLISGPVKAAENAPSLSNQSEISRLLDDQAKRFSYNLTFNVQNCEKDKNYVCDVVVKSGRERTRFLAVSPAKGAPIDHFNIIMDKGHLPLLMSSYAVVTSLVGGQTVTIKAATDFLESEIEQAKSRDGSIEDAFMGTFQRVVVTPHSSVSVTVSY